jgi:tetratricopeptide (TPR) repeat protein
MLVTEALLVAPESPECLQTLASVRISQLRHEDARAALSRSLELWQDLPPEHERVPDFPSRISLARLLMEVQMEKEAIGVLERMILEDDQSVETWYLGGWCHYLLGKRAQESPTEDPTQEEQIQSTLLSSRGWLRQCLKLYDLVGYEDEKLKEHALELFQELEEELKDVVDDSDEGEDGNHAEGGNDEDWEGIDSDDDHEMADS